MEEKELYKQAIDKWGVVAQTDMLVEECAELIQAINKHRRFNNQETLSNLCGEIVDVELMLGQIKFMLNSDPVMKSIRDQKIVKLRTMLDKN